MVTLTFENPEFLWFLFALPLLFVIHFFLLRHTRRTALKFANFAVLKRATGHKYIAKNYTVLVIRILIILCAVLAVSQAVLWYEGETNENEYVIALDTSASMSAQDLAPTRIGAAKQYAKEFVETVDPHTPVGLVSFSGITFIESALTIEHDKLLEAFDEIEISASGTDMPGAIITSTNLLVNSEKGRAIILITDGSNTIESFQSRSIQRATTYAISNRVKIYTIGIGTDMVSPIGYLPSYYNVSATYNTDNLESIANATGGQHYTAANEFDLQRAYDDIGSAEQTSILRTDLTGWLMIAALVLILVEWALINTRFRLLP